MIAAERIVAEARSWAGTPYRHQASAKGAGCDCLGFVRGVYRVFHGDDGEPIPPYSRDWGEATGEETLLAAARRHLEEIAVAHAKPGDVLVFRMRPGAIAKHAGIVTQTGRCEEGLRMIHAQEGIGVAEIALGRWWRRRIVAAFRFPNVAVQELV